MYDYLQGKLAHLTKDSITLEVGGVGYCLQLPVSALNKLPAVGEEARLFTSLIVRESSQTLVGFLCREERDLFEEMITIGGIGPKLGLSILGHLSLEQLFHITVSQDPAALYRVPGIGKKMAERLVLDLRDKFAKVPLALSTLPAADQRARDALSALLNLGYQRQKAERMVGEILKELPGEAPLPELIAAALRRSD